MSGIKLDSLTILVQVVLVEVAIWLGGDWKLFHEGG